MTAIPGYKAKIYATTSPSLSFSNEAFTDPGDHKTFTITNASKRVWDAIQPLTVQTSPDGTTWSTITSGFAVNFAVGQILLVNALSGTTPSVRVSGSYFPYSLIAEAKSVDITSSVEIIDVTTLNSDGWKKKIAGLADGQYKLSKWWIDHFFVDALATHTRLLLSAYSGANANQRFDAFGYIKQDSLKFATTGAITEDLDFETDGPITAVLS